MRHKDSTQHITYHSGKKRYIVRVPDHPAKTCRTLAEAQFHRDRMLKAAATCAPPTNIVQLVDYYLKTLAKLKRQGERLASDSWRLAKLPAFAKQIAKHGMVDVTQHDLVPRFREWRRVGVADATADHRLTFMREVMEFAHLQGLIPANPLMEKDPFQPGKFRDKRLTTLNTWEPAAVFTWDEVRLLCSERARWSNPHNDMRRKVRQTVARCRTKLEAAEELNMHLASVYNWLNRPKVETALWLFVVLAAFTGMRSSEVGAMEWSWIVDGYRPFIRVPAARSKNGRERHVDIHPELLDLLRDMNPDRTRQGGVVNSDGPGKGSMWYSRVSPDASSRSHQLRHYMAYLGLPDSCPVTGRKRTIHSLRHFAGTLMYVLHGDTAARDHLGHHSTQVIARYTSQKRHLENQIHPAVVDQMRRDGFMLLDGPHGRYQDSQALEQAEAEEDGDLVVMEDGSAA